MKRRISFFSHFFFLSNGNLRFDFHSLINLSFDEEKKSGKFNFPFVCIALALLLEKKLLFIFLRKDRSGETNLVLLACCHHQIISPPFLMDLSRDVWRKKFFVVEILILNEKFVIYALILWKALKINSDLDHWHID